MTKRWLTERKKEYYYKKAKVEGYRSRASYKLKQMCEKFNLIKEGDIVIDLGCAPGGWSQVAKEIVGKEGLVIGVDILDIARIEGIVFLKCDVFSSEIVSDIKKILDERRVDIVLSDLSPNISGNYSIDHARSIEMCKRAFYIAKEVLKNNGNFVSKVFQGEYFNETLNEIKKAFIFCKAHAPKAKRARSSEIYIIGKGFIGSSQLVINLDQNKII